MRAHLLSQVQRPALRQLFDTDFASIRLLARGMDAAERTRRSLAGVAAWIG